MGHRFLIVGALFGAALLVWLLVQKSSNGNRVYRIGWEADPPDQFLGPDGQPAGLPIELVGEAARRRGIRLQWVEHNESSEAALRSGQVDLWPLMTVTPERMKILHISSPYIESVLCILVRRDSRFRNVEDLAKSSVGYSGLPITLRQARGYLPDARFIPMRSPRDLITAVCQQRTDAVFLEDHVAITGLMGGVACPDQPLRVIPVAGARVRLGVGSTFAASAVADAIRNEIDAMAVEGRVGELFAKWGYLSGRNVDTMETLIGARRRERWMMAAAALFAILFIIALWGAAWALRERDRSRRAELALRESEGALHKLSGALLRSQDEERRRLARELHDSTAQSVAALGMNLAVVNESAAGLDPRGRRALTESLAITDQCLSEIRTFSYLLHPPVLDELGLKSALEWYVEGFVQRSGIRVDLDVPPDLERLPQELEVVLFRIVQESLTNVHRHSGSQTATIRITRSAADICMEVRDHGGGIRSRTVQSTPGKLMAAGVGIAGMRERVRQIGGRFTVQSDSGGTTVELTLPVSRVST